VALRIITGPTSQFEKQHQGQQHTYFVSVRPLRCQTASRFPHPLHRCSTFFRLLHKYGTQVKMTVVKNKHPAQALRFLLAKDAQNHPNFNGLVHVP
jgi:hypothetical protein